VLKADGIGLMTSYGDNGSEIPPSRLFSQSSTAARR
jgi:hypothetical protein